MTAKGIFGWQLLYANVEQDVRNNQDVLFCLTHLVLVSNGFRCIGLGESKTLEGNEPKSEALPAGWNENYAVRYVFQGRLYNLKATLMDDGIMINLLRVDERNVSLLQLNSALVAQRSGTLDEMIPDNENVVTMINKQLIDQVAISKNTKEGSSQTESTSSEENRGVRSTGVPAPHPYVLPGAPSPFLPIGPGGYGVSDLDPFGGMDPLRGPRLPGTGPGGMLFTPPQFPGTHPPGLPPGAIPPGARFDPFRPPDAERFPPRRNNRPDNDEFPPPGYDDMFM